MSQNQSPAIRHRFREDGWTAVVQREFVEALAESGSVAQACRVVGRSASTAYRLRARPDAHAFRAAWSAATAMAYRQVFELAMDRVVGGQETPVFYDGEHVGFKTVHSDRLLCFMLDHLRPERPVPTARDVARGVDDRSDYGLAWSLAGLVESDADNGFSDQSEVEIEEAALTDWSDEINGPPPPLVPPGPTEAEFGALTEARQKIYYETGDYAAAMAATDDDDDEDED